MNTEAIIEAIDDEILKLQQARHLLNGVEPNPIRAVRRYNRVATQPASVPFKKGTMTPEGRKRIADAMKARWAERRASVKAIKSVKK